MQVEGFSLLVSESDSIKLYYKTTLFLDDETRGCVTSRLNLSAAKVLRLQRRLQRYETAVCNLSQHSFCSAHAMLVKLEQHGGFPCLSTPLCKPCRGLSTNHAKCRSGFCRAGWLRPAAGRSGCRSKVCAAGGQWEFLFKSGKLQPATLLF